MHRARRDRRNIGRGKPQPKPRSSAIRRQKTTTPWGKRQIVIVFEKGTTEVQVCQRALGKGFFEKGTTQAQGCQQDRGKGIPGEGQRQGGGKAAAKAGN